MKQGVSTERFRKGGGTYERDEAVAGSRSFQRVGHFHRCGCGRVCAKRRHRQTLAACDKIEVFLR